MCGHKHRQIAIALVIVMVAGLISVAVVKKWEASEENSSRTEAKSSLPLSNTKGVEAEEGSLKVDAKSAVLIDAGSGKVLYEQNAHDKLPPASVTKVMTMLLALEAVDRGQIHLTDPVTISQRAASMGGSQMFMEAGEQQTVETLLKGMAVASAKEECNKPIY